MTVDWGAVGTTVASIAASGFSYLAYRFKTQLDTLRSDQAECNKKHEDLKEDAALVPTRIDLLDSLTRLEDRFREAEKLMETERNWRQHEVKRLESEITGLRRRLAELQ